MSNLKKILLSILTIFLLTGCSNTPIDTVNTVFNSARNGDIITMIRNTTDKVSGVFSITALKTCSVDKKSFTDDLELINVCLLEKYSTMDIQKIDVVKSTQTKMEVKVRVILNSKEKSYDLRLIKKDDKWIANNIRNSP